MGRPRSEGSAAVVSDKRPIRQKETSCCLPSKDATPKETERTSVLDVHAATTAEKTTRSTPLTRSTLQAPPSRTNPANAITMATTKERANYEERTATENKEENVDPVLRNTIKEVVRRALNNESRKRSGFRYVRGASRRMPPHRSSASAHFAQPMHLPQTYLAPQPTYFAPQPTYFVPQPTYPSSQPTYLPPQPTYSLLQPTYPSSQPTCLPPQPTYPLLLPTYSSSQPTYPPSQPTYPPSQPTYPPSQPTYPPQFMRF